MKTIKYEVKLETSVKIILAVFAVGIFLNAFATPIAQEMFGIKPALADMMAGYLDIYVKECRGC